MPAAHNSSTVGMSSVISMSIVVIPFALVDGGTEAPRVVRF